MTLKVVSNSDSGDADHIGGNDWDNLANAINLGESYMYLVKKSGSTYYVKNSAGEIAHSGATPQTEIQWALDNLTVGRTHKEVLAIRGNITFSKITVPSYTILDCRGAYLKQTDATNTTFIENSDTTLGNTNIDIIGGIFDGNKAGQSGGGGEDTHSMIYLKRCSNVNIIGGKYMNGNAHNIRLRHCPSDIKVIGITSLDARYEHISAHSHDEAARGYVISNNYFENVTAGQSWIATLNVDDVVIANNICKKTFDTTSGIAINGQRNRVISNTCQDCSGVSIYAAQAAGENLNTSGSSIMNNTVLSSAGHGIFVDAGGSGADSQMIIKGNNIDTVTGIGIAIGSKWSNIICEGNIVHDCTQSGIQVYSGATGFLLNRVNVVNNICYNNGKGGGADIQRAGISLSAVTLGDLREVSVYNNRCYDNQGTQTQKYGIRMANTQDCIVKNNDLRTNLTQGLIITIDSRSTISDNEGYVNEQKEGGFAGGSGSSTGGGVGFWEGGVVSNITGSGAYGTVSESTGLCTTWGTGTTINSIVGNRTSGLTTERDLNPYTIWKVRLRTAITNFRAFLGLRSSVTAPASTADPLANLSGVGFWFDTGVHATNIAVMQNNGGANSDKTTIANVGTMVINAINYYEIRADNTNSKWQYRFNGFPNGPWSDINTAIPAATTDLQWVMIGETLDTTSKNLDCYYINVKQDG